jgi:cobalt-zinc-cadmium efflux system outer membrane protein
VRWLTLPFLVFFLGCRACPVDIHTAVEANVADVAPVRAAPVLQPCAASEVVPEIPETLDLSALWQLALAHNPELREAAAELEAARGRRLQAGKCINPRLVFEQDTIGAAEAPEGNFKFEVAQEFQTAGKQRLERQVAGREMDRAAAALLGRKFEVLSRVRRAYYDYLSWVATEKAGAEVIAALEQGLAGTRVRVKAGRPATDLLRIEALLEEARVSQARNHAAREGAWRQLAAEVGVSKLPAPRKLGRTGPVPHWHAEEVEERVHHFNSALMEAAIEVERARAAWERARVEAVPNVTVAAGYTDNRIEHAQGAIVTIEAPVPLWDCKQGLVHEARAQWARAQAALVGTEHRLSREAAAAFASYEARREQVERLSTEVLPRLEKSDALLRKGYGAGSAEVSFADVLQAEQSLASTRLALAEARRALWQAVAELQALMQLDVDEELAAEHTTPSPSAHDHLP